MIVHNYALLKGFQKNFARPSNFATRFIMFVTRPRISEVNTSD